MNVNDNGIVTENLWGGRLIGRMRSFRLQQHHQFFLQEEPLPVPEEGESLLKVISVGICGSDLLSYSTSRTIDAQTKPGLILGHEFVAQDTNGTLFAVDPAIPCGKCVTCLQGNPNLCPEVLFAGHDRQDGALREWINWPSRCLFPLPSVLSPAEGVMLEPLGIALHALHLCHFQLGMNAGVFGCGPIGLLLIQLLRLNGANRIIATDTLPHRVAAAKKLGADNAFQVSVDHSAKLILPAVDIAFDCSGSEGAVRDAFESTVPGGKVILIGIPESDQTSFQASVARRKGLTILLVRRMKHTYPAAIQLAISKKADLESLITHRYPFDKTPLAFDIASQRQGLKVIIEF